MSLIVAICLSLSRTVPESSCMTLTVSSSSMELLHVFQRLLWLPPVSHYLSDPMEFACLSLSPMVANVSNCLSDPMDLLHVSHCLFL